jgi:predicted ATPase
VRALSVALVERETELEALERRLASACEGWGGAVVVEGAAGIGKSSLLAAAREAAGDLRVLSARGGEFEREFPFGVVRQLLEPVLVGAGGDERDALLAGAAALAEPVLGAPDVDADADPPFAALHGLYWLAVNLASLRPVLVVVDNVQWADLASLRWLVYLARRLEGVPLALLLATRPAEPGPARELLDDLVAVPEVGVLYPGDLSTAAVSTLAAATLGAQADTDFVAACHAATGGNPFLLRELLDELSRRGLPPSREHVRLAGELSSRGVVRSVRARLRGLGPECAALARAVALLGDPAEPTLAARLAGLDARTAAKASQRLADASIVEAGPALAFVHPLVRSSVATELSAEERAAGHARAAQLLSDAGAAPDRVSLHLLETPGRGRAEVVGTLRLAAAGATRRGAPDVAVAYLRRALAEPPASELLPTVAHELGAAALRAGDLETAIAHLREVTHALSDQRGAEAANALGSALFLVHRPRRPWPS